MSLGKIESFREKLKVHGLIDPDGVHHEFARPGHGQKIDFGLLASGRPLYQEWVALTASQIKEIYFGKKLAVLGIDSGTNRLAYDVGMAINAHCLQTEKIDERTVRLTQASVKTLKAVGGLVVGVEDVGTTGGTVASGLQDALEHGADRVGAVITWQRTEVLSELVAAGINYNALIDEIMPTYPPEVCREIGFCSMNWELIRHREAA